jgi:hypothetical protein
MNRIATLLTCFVVLCAVAGVALALGKPTAFNFATIDFPGANATFPFGINPQGDVVGNYVAGRFIHGFLLSEGTFTTIDFPGATATFARGINPQGDIAGFYVTGRINHGFLLQQGAFTTIDFPGAMITLAFGINPRGDIVGW